jgi:hypothetical protein
MSMIPRVLSGLSQITVGEGGNQTKIPANFTHTSLHELVAILCQPIPYC